MRNLSELLASLLTKRIRTRMSKRWRPDYHAYIRSFRWKRKADHIRHKDGYRCRDCDQGGWEVHHLTYDRLGFELDSDLVTLCRSCHEARHEK
jgi:5-methylcytosine-specific restriction endonuclease McrA